MQNFEPKTATPDVIEIDLREVFNKLLKHRRTILNVTGICVVAALIYSYTAQPVYSAVSRILVEGKPPKIVKVEGTVLPDYTDHVTFFNSQIEVLNSRMVAEIVLNDLKDYEPWGRRGKPAHKLKPMTRAERIDLLKKHVKVSPVRMTEVIKVTAEDPNPDLAARIANEWVRAYVLFSSQDQLVQRRSELEADMAQQLKFVKEKHPVIVGLKSEIAAINEKIAQEDRQTGKASSGTNAITNVKVLDRAEVPLRPDRPRKALNGVLALVLGLFAGAGLVFLFDSLDQTLRSPADLETFLKLPCLVSVPVHETEKGQPDAEPEFVSERSRHSQIAEAFRSLRTGILYSNPDHAKKTFLVTSAVPDEGKTTVAVNLATVFAQADEKVLLVDTDLRAPSLHSVFKVDRVDGVVDLLAFDNADVHALIHKTSIKGLDLLTCGEVPPNPSELLSSKKMEALIAKLATMYDRVIFDTPPVLAATDALVLSAKVDATILVLKAGATHRHAAEHSAESLRKVHAHVLGAVFNKVSPDQHGVHYSYYPYGQNDPKTSAGGKGISKLKSFFKKTAPGN